jgi:hypothetical protein
VEFILATSGYNFVRLNGQLIHSWGAPYPSYNTLKLRRPQLKCGCNTLEVTVYNYCCPSPCALTYSLTTSKAGCYDCDRLGVTRYNRNTCSCECTSTSQCSNPLMRWQAYPMCGCVCLQERICPRGQFFDWGTCQCECEGNCCAAGSSMFQGNCSCSSGCIPVSCPSGQKWEQSLCNCEPICSNASTSCPAGMTWDPLSCACNCLYTAYCLSPTRWSNETCSCVCISGPLACAYPRFWNTSSCSCQCPQTGSCPNGQIWNLTTCQCSCLAQQCLSGYGWNSSDCRCLPLPCLP